jgi:sulfur-oxidizing protein SoxY
MSLTSFSSSRRARVDSRGRRGALRGLALLLSTPPLLGMLWPRRARAQASPQEQIVWVERDVEKRLGKFQAREGRIHIALPALAENGNSVPCVFEVDSPMTETDYVRSLHVWAGRNPRPFVISAQFSPANPRARIETRLRLGETQRIYAWAQMSDGSWWSGHQDVTVAVSACNDGSG